MKSKIICLVTCLVLISSVFIVNAIDVRKTNRVHQHLSNTKTVKTDDVEEFNTHLPIVSIDTNGQEIPKEAGLNSTIKSNVKIYDTAENRNNYLTDSPAIETLSNIKIKGTTSRDFAKKNYLLKFINADGTKNNQAVMGMAEHNEWVLHGPFLDKTLIRNYMWYNIGAEIMGYAPNVRFCEVFLNNKYIGLYVMADSITVGKGRINITEASDNDVACSYIVRLDRGNLDPNKNLNNFGKYAKRINSRLTMDIIYPGINDKNIKLKEYIEKDFSKFEKALYSYDYKEYDKYIDVDSFVDYFIINEFTQNYDAGNLSTYIYKDIRGKLNLCMWDYNSACDNYISQEVSNMDFDFQNNVWYIMLLRDPEFTDKIINRYRELRKSYLNEEYLLNYIDETVEYLGDAKDRNFEVWGYTFLPENDLLPEEKKIGSYEEAIKQLKTFIINRGRWLDEHIEEIKQFSHESTTKKFNH